MKKIKNCFSFKHLSVLFIILTGIIFAVIPLLRWVSFWDDSLFLDSRITSEVQTPFAFWSWFSGYTKAWPMWATLVWTNFQLNWNPIITFKLFSSVVHLQNTALIYRLMKKLEIRFALAGTIIYFFHPGFVAVLSWAFQFPSLAAIFAILLLLNLTLNQEYRFRKEIPVTLGLFILSQSLKPWAGLFFLFPTLTNLRQINTRKFFSAALTSLFLFGIGFYFYDLSRQGINTFAAEKSFSRSLFYNENKQIPMGLVLDNVTEHLPRPYNPEDKILVSALYVGESAFYYFSSALFPDRLWLINSYPEMFKLQTVFGWASILALASLSLFGLSRPDRKNRFAAGVGAFLLLTGWLPFSGLFYIPYMKFTLYSAHWMAFQIPGFVILLISLFQWAHDRIKTNWQPKMRAALWVYALLILLLGLQFTYRFNMDRYQYLSENKTICPQVGILDYLKSEALSNLKK